MLRHERLAWFGALALTIALLPVALVAGIWQRIRGGADIAPDELAEVLRGASEDRRADWDQLECVDIKDAQLEAIRQKALAVSLPLTPEGRLKLVGLAEQAEALSHVDTPEKPARSSLPCAALVAQRKVGQSRK